MVIGLVASVLLHVLASVLLGTAGTTGPALPASDGMTLVDFDIHEAPAPPEAELAPEQQVDQQAEEGEGEEPAAPEPLAEEETSPEAEEAASVVAEVVPEGISVADAGVPDATAVAEAEPADAAPADAAPAALAEADPPPDAAAAPDATAVAEAEAEADAGAVAEAEAEADADAGAVAEAEADADAVAEAEAGAVAEADPEAASAPGSASASAPASASDPVAAPGAGAASAVPSPAAVAAGTSLLTYLPPDDVVAVFLRFDRLRGTPWAAPAEAILAPMPDYRTLIGDRSATVADLFDSVIISTPRPRDVTATTLAGRTPMAGPAARTFLDHAGARVAWYTARGGPAGRRLPSPRVPARDARTFLMPFPGWIVLTQPGHLGSLLAPAEGDIDLAMAASADLPPWLVRLRDIEDTMGSDTGPVLAATVEGLLPSVYDVPYVGPITTPRRLTSTVDITKGGFYIRGTLLFDSAASASLFVTTARKAQVDLTASRLGRMYLSSIRAYNALRGLDFERDGARVAYATSIGVADAQAMLARAAQWARDFFERPARRSPSSPSSPPPVTPAP